MLFHPLPFSERKEKKNLQQYECYGNNLNRFLKYSHFRLTHFSEEIHSLCLVTAAHNYHLHRRLTFLFQKDDTFIELVLAIS